MLWRGLGMIVAGFAVLASSVTMAAGWKVHSYSEDKFEIEYPEGVEVKRSPVELTKEASKNVSRTVQYMYDGGGVAYLAALSVNKYSTAFEKGSEDSFASLKCSTKTSDKPLVLQGERGREMQGTGCSGGELRMDARYFVVGKSFYQVLAIYSVKDGDEAAAHHFVESFKFLRGRKSRR